MVLIPAESGGLKVLLTNTVFPMGAHDNKPPRPRYRLRSKSKPEFALRSVSVATTSLVLPGCLVSLSRLSPGGEWENDSDSGESVFSIISVKEAGVHEDTEAPNVENQNTNKSGGEAETLSSGFEGWDFWDEEIIDGEKRSISKGIVETSDPAGSDWSFLNAYINEGRYDFGSCLEVLRTWVKRFPAPNRKGLEGDKAYAVLGLYSQGGLAYVKHTLDYGIDFLAQPGPVFGSHGQLATPRSPTVVELYSDASHSPDGGRSTQCSVVLWLGACILWESSRQSFTTLSSAESELVSLVHTAQVGESVQPIIEELIEQNTQLSLQGDNMASIRAFEPGTGGWRNRHLRMRSAAARERVDSGALVVQHISGEFQVADIGTKSLGSSRIIALLKLANVTGSAWSHALAQTVSPEVCVLRGLCSCSRNSSSRVLRNLIGIAEAGVAVDPTTLFVLTLLAVAQPANGQPLEPILLFSWFEWTVIVRWVWCITKGLKPYHTGSTIPPTTEPAPTEQGIGPPGIDELDAREIYTGLTLIQRARLRRQLLRGEIVEAPILSACQ